MQDYGEWAWIFRFALSDGVREIHHWIVFEDSVMFNDNVNFMASHSPPSGACSAVICLIHL
jgi:hypothetical protein